MSSNLFPKILSYHPNKSSGLGGIETLIRSLHKVAYSLNMPFVEYYNVVSGDNKKYFAAISLSSSSYIKITLPDAAQGILREVFKSISFAAKVFLNKDASHVIIYSPSYSIFLFPWVLRGRKLIIVQSNKLEVFFKSKLARISYKFNSKNWSSIIVYTNADKLELNKHWKVPPEKIYVIPRGCKLKISDKPAHYSKKLVTIARIQEGQKNFSEMLNVIDLLPSDFSLDIYGTGSEKETAALKEKIQAYSNVKYCGVTMDVASTLSNYSIFLMTSFYEGFGQTLIEARSQGLPIVVYKTFLAAETIIKNNYNGFLVKPYDTEAFVDSVKLILKSESDFSRHSHYALSFAQETENLIVEKKWRDLLQV